MSRSDLNQAITSTDPDLVGQAYIPTLTPEEKKQVNLCLKRLEKNIYMKQVKVIKIKRKP